MSPFEPSSPQRHVLAAGQSLSLRLRAGSTVQVRRGSVTLGEPPRWVGETMLRLSVRLGEGQLHGCSDGGWIELQAGAERTELWCHAPAPGVGAGFVQALRARAAAAARGFGLRSAGGC